MQSDPIKYEYFMWPGDDQYQTTIFRRHNKYGTYFWDIYDGIKWRPKSMSNHEHGSIRASIRPISRQQAEFYTIIYNCEKPNDI